MAANQINSLLLDGIQPVVVVGGATSRIRDPSGKRDDRPELEISTILPNTNNITKSIKSIFQAAAHHGWSCSFHFISFLIEFDNNDQNQTLIL